jgi:hypothetical protein
MNEILAPSFHRHWRKRKLVRRALRHAGRAFGLGGLFAWRLDDHWLRIERHEMPIAGLGADLDGATLAHISDLHCSPIVLERYLGRCVEAINELEPDFVAMTGDFITGPAHYARRVAGVLGGLHSRIATVACLGNHDYGMLHPSGLGTMRGLARHVTERLSHMDIFVMRNESRIFHKGDASLQFVGLEDFWTSFFNPHEAFELVRPGVPTIALCHNPDAAPLLGDFPASWILSGHTHGSPLPTGKVGTKVLPSKNRQFAAGHYELPDGATRLYVNRGLSYGRRMNLNSRPEVTLFTLRSTE